MFLTIIVFLITILILVLVHELGHFLMCKRFNIKVLEFGFGIPPKIWGKKIGETLYSLNLLPIGGFVRPLGEDETDKEVLTNKRSFASQTPWKKIAVVVAGVVMNTILAWIIFWGILAVQGFKIQIPSLPALSGYQFSFANQSNDRYILISDVAPNSPAKAAGLNAGDRVIALNNTPLTSVQELINGTRDNIGKPLKLTISDLHNTTQKTIEVTPRENPPQGQGALGVSLGSMDFINLSYDTPIQKLLSGPIYSYNLLEYSFSALGQTITSSIAKKDLKPVSDNVAGPIGITRIVSQILTVENPFIPYLHFMGALSLNLAFVNILPFPGLDGGRLVFLLFEAFTRKKTHPAIEKYVHTFGLAFLIGMILLVTMSDIRKFF